MRSCSVLPKRASQLTQTGSHAWGAADSCPHPVYHACESRPVLYLALYSMKCFVLTVKIGGTAEFKRVGFVCLLSLLFSYPFTIFSPTWPRVWEGGLAESHLGRSCWACPNPAPQHGPSSSFRETPLHPHHSTVQNGALAGLAPPSWAVSHQLISTCNKKINIWRRYF